MNRRKDKHIALSNLTISSTWKISKSHIRINLKYKFSKFKISAQTWNEEFKLPDGSYSISYIQDYFQYILKKHEEKTVNSSIRIYTNKNKTENISNF